MFLPLGIASSVLSPESPDERATGTDALQKWIVSPHVNRSGVADADPSTIEPERLDGSESA